MKFLKYTIISLIMMILFSTLFVFYVLWKFSPELPSYNKIVEYKPNLSSRIYSSDGLLLKSFFLEERIFIPIERIPENVKQAFISAEDKNFYDHFGIDLLAITRALATNILSYSSNRRVVGASTITQQVVKNLLLTNEISYKRKIKEILLAIRIENILEKDTILELYLNDIYLGYGSYGIGTASLNYFNKSINELELHEIAFLAALPKAPNNYHPVKKYNNAIERRNWVIDRMYSNKFIKEVDLEYKNYSLKTRDREYNLYTDADYYFEEIRKKLYNQLGENNLYSEGLIIKTSIDTKIQTLANESLIEGLIDFEKAKGWNGKLDNIEKELFQSNQSVYNNITPFNNWKPVIVDEIIDTNILVVSDTSNNKYNINLNATDNKWLINEKFEKGDVFNIEIQNNNTIIRQIPKVNGAIVVINPHNGNVLALSGGYSFRNSEFNRATQAKRQPGSAFKPFVYISALKEGYTPSTLILDAPYVVDQGPGLPKWKPANYTEEFYGLTTMRTGIEKSRNLMTVRLADKIGMNKILKTASDFGIDTHLNDQLSMSLGSGLVTLIDITNAYGIIANGGKKIKPKIIQSIYSKDGKQIFSTNEKNCINCILEIITNNVEIPNIFENKIEVIDSKIAFQITSMMEGVVNRGTAKRLNNLNVPIAGKTGTTNDNKDAWFIGYSPNIVVGVYVGYDTPKSLGYKQTGSSVAVPIFAKFSEKINMNNLKVPFRVPSGISFVRIDPKTGLPSNKENSILEPYILGTEPYSKNLNVIDTLNNFKNNSISGTGGLLN
mgnify:CR=1 FL=1